MDRPKVGVGVFIKKDGKILLGKRLSKHGYGEYALPGGHLEGGEEFIDCCKREVFEETGLAIKNVKPLSFTNDIFHESAKHYVTLFFISDYDSGELENKEPEKCEGWQWYTFDNLPQPMFPPLTNIIKFIKEEILN